MSSIIRGSGPRDGLPDYVVRNASRNEIGILSGVVLRHYKVGAVNQRVDPQWLNRFDAPDPGWGIPCINCEGEISNSICTVTYYYKGTEESYSFQTDDEVIYELDLTWGNESIQSHPKFTLFKQRFGWDETERRFPEFASGVQDGQHALDTADTKQVLNPLAGVDQYYVFGATFKRTYAARHVPASIYHGIGTVISRPEGIEKVNFPAALTGKRFWLRMAPQISKRGNVVQIIETAMLGKEGGKDAAKIIYRSAQLDG